MGRQQIVRVGSLLSMSKNTRQKRVEARDETRTSRTSPPQK